MPRYYFDVHKGDKVSLDDTGLEMDGIDTVWEELAKGLCDLIHELLPNGERTGAVMEVRDETGRRVLTASLSITVEDVTYPPGFAPVA
jgi:hypothetical protein